VVRDEGDGRAEGRGRKWRERGGEKKEKEIR